MSGQYDLIIVGGGMVGASLAIALSGLGLKMALVEAAQPEVDAVPNYDDRAIALAYGSSRIFSGLGVWQDIEPVAEAIRRIHISERGGFGFAHMDAADENLPALGYVATARDLGVQLLAAMKECGDLTIVAPARVTGVIPAEHRVDITLQRAGVTERLSAALLVAADGGDSFVRDAVGIPTRRWEYGQSAVVANISPARAHGGVAYERFTDEGPVALLPMNDNRCALVWTLDDAALETVLGYDDATFLQMFQDRFGWRLGHFQKVGRRTGYPLSHIRATESVRQRVAVIGNAAHTLHPIAGQGFNLGIRDVAALADVVATARQTGTDLGAESVLQNYDNWRRRDQQLTALATDGMARLFSNPLLPLKAGRNIGLAAVDALPFLKHGIVRAAVGLNGRLPRLSRGLPVG